MIIVLMKMKDFIHLEEKKRVLEELVDLYILNKFQEGRENEKKFDDNISIIIDESLWRDSL